VVTGGTRHAEARGKGNTRAATKEDTMHARIKAAYDKHITGKVERGETQAIEGQPARYCKVRFVSKYHHGATAGLIWAEHELRGKSIEDISRRYPMSEFRKMDRLERSPWFATWDEAFGYEFK